MSTYILKETSSGKFTLVHRNSHDIRLHSGYDPGKEAERAVAGFSAGRSTVIAVSGIGLGYHIDCLKKKFPGKLICALEHDPEDSLDLVRGPLGQRARAVLLVALLGRRQDRREERSLDRVEVARRLAEEVP